jgi:hypothetical protein
MMHLLSIALLLSSQPKETPSVTPCGIELSQSSLTLFHDVETRLGKAIRCETHLEFGVLGASDVGADGTPEIVLDTYEGKTEENLVHELFHLQLHAQGFPQHFRVRSARAANRERFQQVAEQLGSLIEHRLFYPQMRRMGFDPTGQYRIALENSLSQEKLYGTPRPATRTVSYAEIALLIHDPALTRTVEKWYLRHGWTDQLSRGKQLARYLAVFNPDTPAKKRTAIMTCLEIVFGHKVEVTWLP